LFAINPFFCIYNLIVLLSSFLSDNPGYTEKASLVFIGTNVFFIYIGKEYTFKDLFFILVWVNIELLLMSVFRGNHGGAWTGVFAHKNAFGLTMALVPIVMYLQSVRIPKYRWLFLGLAALAVFCVQKSQSGMAKVLFILLLSLLGFLRFIKRLPPRLAFASMGMFLAIGISLLILISENAEYIIVEKLGKDMTLTGRTYIWSLVVPAINRHPWLGYGYQGFWQPWRGLENPANIIRHPKFGDFIPMHSHNGFLDMALNVGWVGLALFILSLLVNLYYGVQHLTRSKGPESVLPLVVLTWAVMSNITENGIDTITSSWILYVVMTARLTMDNTLDNFRGKPQLQESYNQSRLRLNSSNRGEGG
jgi:O-antigen ligase